MRDVTEFMRQFKETGAYRTPPERLGKPHRNGLLTSLTFNTRAIALFLSLFIDEPWLYFVFEITLMSFLFFYMRHKHETLCKRLYKELTSSSNA